MNTDFDTALRVEAIRWLTVRTNDGADPISTKELLDFEFSGECFRLMDRHRGIRKPKVLDSALSIRTTFTRPGRNRMYEDTVGPDGLLRYKWRGDDQGHAENKALRAAMDAEVPLVWFFGIAEGVYQPVFPVYLLWEEREQQQFVIAPDAARGLVHPGHPLDENVAAPRPGVDCTSRSSGRRCCGRTPSVAPFAPFATPCSSTRPTSWPTAMRPGSRPSETALPRARLTTPLRPSHPRRPAEPGRRDPRRPAGRDRRPDAPAWTPGTARATPHGCAAGASATPRPPTSSR